MSPLCSYQHWALLKDAAALVTGAAEAAFAAKTAVLVPVGAAAALVGAKAVSFERSTAPATDGAAAASAETNGQWGSLQR